MPTTLITACLILASLSMARAAGSAIPGEQTFQDSVASVSARARAAAAVTRASIDESELLELLEDSDPEVRKAALVAARDVMGIHTRVRGKVLDMASDPWQGTEVRREAARALYWATQLPEAREKLLELARRDPETSVRVMATKALFMSSALIGDVRKQVLDAARGEKDPDVRRAALWALFDSNVDPDVAAFLTELASSRGQDAQTRLEALKSLYLGMDRPEVREAMKGLAADAYEGKAIRVAAVYILHAARRDPGVKDVLDDLVQGADRQLKLAAVKALGENDAFFRAYFHLGEWTDPHHYIPPIVNE